MKSDFEILVLGNACVGKTTYIEKVTYNNFIKEYVPTDTINFSSLTFETNYGTIKFHISDYAGSLELVALGKVAVQSYDAALVFFDVTDKQTYKGSQKWIKDFLEYKPNTPVVLCGNKVDLEGRKIKYEITNEYEYYDISTKSDYNLENPFLYLARVLTGHDDLILNHSKTITYMKIPNNGYLKTIQEYFVKGSSFPEYVSTEENKPYRRQITWMNVPDGGDIRIIQEYYTNK